MSTSQFTTHPPESQRVTEVELASQMQQLANRIRPFDPNAADRLTVIAQQLSESSNPAQSIDQLLNLDLYQVINPDTIERRAVEYRSPSTGLGYLETIRNGLVLFPILITWIALSVASYNYAQTVADPRFVNEATKPFLLLWEQGFPAGILTWLRFSWVAFFDFAVLGVVILMTFYFHYRTEVQSQQIKRQAVTLRQEVEDVLWQLSQLFSRRRLLRAPDQGALEAAEKMNQAALTLEATTTALAGHADRAAMRAETLAQLHQTFSQQQAELRAQLHSLHQQQQQVVAQVSDSVQQIDIATKEMQASLQKVSDDFAQAVTAAKEAASAASNGLALAQNAVSEAGRAATAVKGVEQQLGAVVGQLTTVTGALTRAHESLTKNADQAAQLNQGIYRATQNIDAVAAKIDSVAAKIDTLPANLQSISASLERSANQTSTTAQATAGLVQQLGTLVAQLPAIARDLQTVAGSLNGTAQEMSRSVTDANTANQSLHQAVQIFSQSTQQTAQAFVQGTQQTVQAFSQSTQQTAQSFAQGVQQTAQAFTQNIVRPLVTEVDAIKAQLNYAHQHLQNLPGVGQPFPSYWMRFTKWLAVLVLAALFLPTVILVPWFVTQAAWGSVVVSFIVAILLAVALASALAWQR
jgi:ABC-type transporter Mla subunit MlaD